MTEDIALKDFVLNLKDKLMDITSFIETDTYVDHKTPNFDMLCHIGWLIYDAQTQLDVYIEKNFPGNSVG